MDTNPPSYHDLYITTAHIPRTSIFNLPFDIRVECTRTTGWTVSRLKPNAPYINIPRYDRWMLIAGEYEGEGKGLKLDVCGVVICDSLTPGENSQ